MPRIRRLAPAESGKAQVAPELWTRGIGDTDPAAELIRPVSWAPADYPRCRISDPSLDEHFYRRLLNEQPTLTGTTTTKHINLAEILLDRGSARDVDEAAELPIRLADHARHRSRRPASAGDRLPIAMAMAMAHESRTAGDRPRGTRTSLPS